MAALTTTDLRARHARLLASRQENLTQLEQCREREHGFRYVLGELELMIRELEAREAEEQAAAAAADLAALAEQEKYGNIQTTEGV